MRESNTANLFSHRRFCCEATSETKSVELFLLSSVDCANDYELRKTTRLFRGHVLNISLQENCWNAIYV